MKKYYIFMIAFLFFISTNLAFGVDNSDSKLIPIQRLIQVSVAQLAQKKELIVPSDPLSFDTTLEWEVTIEKVSLASEKDAAFFTVEDFNKPGKQLERKTSSASGKLNIPKGTKYKITLYAGEYSRLLSKDGTEVYAKLKYTEAQVRYSMGDKPHQFNFEVIGPEGLDQWNWFWGSNDKSSGKSIEHQFSSDGRFPVVVEGNGKTLSGVGSQKFYFELEVPPLIVLDPKVEPLSGPAELNVTAKVNAVVNYGQKATYTWNFGNGVELTGPEAGNNYVQPGNYQLVLTAQVGESIFQKSWLIDVLPLNIAPNPVMTPLSGPVPLEVIGTAHPSINGGPTQLRFNWIFGEEITEGSQFKHKFTEPGEYQVVFKTVDKLHQSLVIPDTVFLVKALPPQIHIKPTASISKGLIPLAVNFDPQMTIQGSPVELIYRWDFGDGETANQPKPTHIFKKPGTYDVQLTVTDRLHQGNLVTGTLKVEVMAPEMKVTAIPSVTSGLAPLKVSFNTQIGVTGSPCDPQYLWDFGDGGTAVEQNPVHIFKQEGEYVVTLEVKDWLHPSSTVKTSLTIEVKLPKIRLTANVSPSSGKAPLTVNCQAWADKEGDKNPEMKYIWDFGDGVVVEGMDQKHTFVQPGTYNVLVYVEDLELGITERKNFKVVVK